MTPDQRSRDLSQRLAEAAATAAVDVDGVARLRPDLAATLREAVSPRITGRSPRALPSVRMRPASGGRDRWRASVELRITIHRGHRAVDVSRAVHDAVSEVAARVLPNGSGSEVTVTVTGVL